MSPQIKQQCVTELLKAGLAESQINLVELEKDWFWWEDVELTCLFYIDKIKVK